jgi:hypothetical protein
MGEDKHKKDIPKGVKYNGSSTLIQPRIGFVEM